MAAKGKTISKKHRDAIRQAAIARHAARKEAGLPAPSGLPYITPPDPPAPEPVAVPAPVEAPVAAPSGIDLTPFYDLPEVPLEESPNPALVAPLDPRGGFAQWLRSREGIDASDPRMSQDRVRQGAELEDRLRVAWLAGHQTGRAGA